MVKSLWPQTADGAESGTGPSVLIKPFTRCHPGARKPAEDIFRRNT